MNNEIYNTNLHGSYCENTNENKKYRHMSIDESKIDCNKSTRKRLPSFYKQVEKDLDIFHKTFNLYYIIDKNSEEEIKSINDKKIKKELIKTSKHIGSKKQESFIL